MSFLNLVEYRMNFLWETLGTVVTNLILYLFWATILSGQSSPAYSSSAIGVYYLTITLVDQFTNFSGWEIANTIRSGLISAELARPYNFHLKSFLMSLGDRLTKFTISLAILLLVIYLGRIQLTIIQVFGFGLTLILAAVCKYFINSTLATFAFWFNRVPAITSLFWSAGGLFSGQLIPLDLLPEIFVRISQFLPFSYLVYHPAHMLTTSQNIQSILPIVLAQLFWAAVFAVLNALVWKKGIRNVESIGG